MATEHWSPFVTPLYPGSGDADLNEQAAIQLYLARTTAADVIGPHGGPGDGFTVTYKPEAAKKSADLVLTRGRCYVDGILVDSTIPPVPFAVGSEPVPEKVPVLTYWEQPFAYLDQENEDDLLPSTLPFLI